MSFGLGFGLDFGHGVVLVSGWSWFLFCDGRVLACGLGFRPGWGVLLLFRGQHMQS